MLAYLIVATVFPALIMGYPYRSCGGNIPTPSAIRIVGCPESPCMVVPGSIMYYEADFITPIFTHLLEVRAFLTIFGIEAEVPLDNNDGCTKSVPQCPHDGGQFVTIAEEVRIPQLPANIPAMVRVRLFNANGENFVCSELHGITVAPTP